MPEEQNRAISPLQSLNPSAIIYEETGTKSGSKHSNPKHKETNTNSDLSVKTKRKDLTDPPTDLRAYSSSDPLYRVRFSVDQWGYSPATPTISV